MLKKKPSKQSKAKKNGIALKFKLGTWTSGNIMELFREDMYISNKADNIQTPHVINRSATQFTSLMKSSAQN